MIVVAGLLDGLVLQPVDLFLLPLLDMVTPRPLCAPQPPRLLRLIHVPHAVALVDR